MESDRVSQPLDTRQLETLLAHLIFCQDVLQLATNKVSVELFDDNSEATFKLIWSIVLEFWTKHKCLIPVDYLAEEVGRRILLFPESTREMLLDEAANTIANISSLPIVSSLGKELLRRFLWERTTGIKLAAIARSNCITPKMWQEILQSDQKATISDVVPFQPFSGNPILGVEPRDPTGVKFIDVLMNGGARKGRVYGMLGFSGGGGKTTLSHQIAVSYAKMGRMVSMYSYEECPNDPEYLQVPYAMAYGIPKSRLEKLGRKEVDWTEEERTKVDQANELLSKTLVYHDLSPASGAGNGGVPEIERILNTRIEQNGRPDLLIVDWFWPLVQRYYAAIEVARGKRMEDYTLAAQIVEQLKGLAKKYQLWIWLPHNFASDKAHSNKLTFEDAMGFKGFGQYLDGCFLLHKLDSNNTTIIEGSKFRAGSKNIRRRIRLDGEMGQFVEIGTADNLVYNSKLGQYVDNSSRGYVSELDISLDYEGGYSHRPI